MRHKKCQCPKEIIAVTVCACMTEEGDMLSVRTTGGRDRGYRDTCRRQEGM